MERFSGERVSSQYARLCLGYLRFRGTRETRAPHAPLVIAHSVSRAQALPQVSQEQSPRGYVSQMPGYNGRKSAGTKRHDNIKKHEPCPPAEPLGEKARESLDDGHGEGMMVPASGNRTTKLTVCLETRLGLSDRPDRSHDLMEARVVLANVAQNPLTPSWRFSTFSRGSLPTSRFFRIALWYHYGDDAADANNAYHRGNSNDRLYEPTVESTEEPTEAKLRRGVGERETLHWPALARNKISTTTILATTIPTANRTAMPLAAL